ncbi:von Willebrand factor A domain-containing protein 5A [Clonorchis sinensis]|uniref:von Willebrand factor A domain-containing protein 5A n=1 Tax=Clonorchis sinensis TaxID=79923 RepID=A0A8T1M9T0_CLOSI|nr:von Willebrand factor A domain-containing protein 5A [Clonorchis sinensis]
MPVRMRDLDARMNQAYIRKRTGKHFLLKHLHSKTRTGKHFLLKQTIGYPSASKKVRRSQITGPIKTFSWQNENMQKFGLFSFLNPNEPVQLKAVTIRCNVAALTSNVVTTFTYYNQYEEASDAKFVFPLDDVALYAFEAQIGERVIIAECRPREEAQTVYKEAVAKEHGVILVEQEESSEDLFQISVGNVPAKETVKITIKYIGYLLADNITDDTSSPHKSEAVFLLPSVINPRYSPPESEIAGEYDPFAHPSQTNATPYSISFEANVKMPHTILRAFLIDDEYTTEIDPTDKRRAKIILKSRNTFDHDLKMVIRMDAHLRSFAVAEPGISLKSSIMAMDCIMAQFLPDFSKFSSQQGRKTELVFVIDRSGSMDGSGIKSAAEALLLMLKSLPIGCRFQIIGFGNTHEALFREPVEYNDRTLARALAYQKSLRANMGGTLVLPALKAAYDAPLTGKDWYRQILFITDGYVSNANEVIGLAASNVHKAKLFPIGIRLDSGKHLLMSLARAGRGTAAFVQDDSKLRGVLMKILGAALQPRADEIKVQWELRSMNNGSPITPLQVLTIPECIPAVFHGKFITVYGLIPAGSSVGLSGTVSLQCDVLDEKQLFTVELSKVAKEAEFSSKEVPLHRLAGKCQLNELGDRYKAERMSNKFAEDPEMVKLRGTIEKISCAINILSPVTAMVGVDPVKREPVLKKYNTTSHSGIPTPEINWQVTNSRSMQFRGLGLDGSMFLCSRRTNSSLVKSCGASGVTQHVFPESSSGSTLSTPTWLKLAELQNAKGNWDLNANLAKLFEIQLKQLRSLKPVSWPAPATKKMTTTVWATVLSLVYLSLRAQDAANEWSLLANKARSWLVDQAREFEKDLTIVKQLCEQLLTLAENVIKME